MTPKLRNSILIICTAVLLLSCSQESIQPKPRGYFRIDTPDKSYTEYNSTCPFDIEIPNYSQIELIPSQQYDTCWFNISFPRFNAKIHCTYLPVDTNIHHLLNEAYHFAFKHETKANAIKREPFNLMESNVHGLIYDLEGHVATSLQFYATDSTNHFLRGALYFHSKPNPDSLAPVLAFIREDLQHLIHTIEWR